MISSPYFWSVCPDLFFVDCRQYLETRSFNQRLDARERLSVDMACEEDSRDGTCKERDRDWHHYSKSSGRSGRSGRSRRSSRRHRDGRRRRSQSHHRSSAVRELPSPLYPPLLSLPPNHMGHYHWCLANASHRSLCLSVSLCVRYSSLLSMISSKG